MDASLATEEPRAHPIEKAIFYRLCRLLRLNVQLVFIFDGPRRPWKRGKPAGHVDLKLVGLLRDLLEVFGIPRYEAPAEAEAECARLQRAGLVDAVWSDDGDTLMFGSTILIRDFYEDKGGKSAKSETHIRLYRADKIWNQCQLDSKALVLFAILSGGDYATSGLKGCGPDTALKAAQAGLGTSLCAAPAHHLANWSRDLSDFFKARGIRIEVPPDFPRSRDLINYKNPLVSSSSHIDWGVPVDQDRLRIIVARYFNIWTPKFIEHVVPTLLVRTLAQTLPNQRASNKSLDVQLVKQTKKQATGGSVERTITYLPLEATTIQQIPLDGEDYSKSPSKDGAPYDPSQRVECEVLECLLRASLPEATFSGQGELAVPKGTKKRPAKGDQSDVLLGKPPKKKPTREVPRHPDPTAPQRTEKQPKTTNHVSSGDSHPLNTAPTADGRAILDIFTDSDDEDNGYDLLRRSCGRPPPAQAGSPLEQIRNLQDALEPGPDMDRGQSNRAVRVPRVAPALLLDDQKENFAGIGAPVVDRKQQEQERLARRRRKAGESLSHPPLAEQSRHGRTVAKTREASIEVIDLT